MCKQRGPQSPENTVSLGHGVIDAKGMVGRVEGRWEVAERTHGMVTVALGGPLAPLGTEGTPGSRRQGYGLKEILRMSILWLLCLVFSFASPDSS